MLHRTLSRELAALGLRADGRPGPVVTEADLAPFPPAVQRERLLRRVARVSGCESSRATRAAALARRGRDVVVVDLRGRGASPRTRVGSYGWENHAADVLEVATQLGLDTFDLVGHSMGALVGMRAAAFAPDRVRRLVAIDTAGPTDLLALSTLGSAVLRLPFVYPATGAYRAMMRTLVEVPAPLHAGPPVRTAEPLTA